MYPFMNYSYHELAGDYYPNYYKQLNIFITFQYTAIYFNTLWNCLFITYLFPYPFMYWATKKVIMKKSASQIWHSDLL